MNFSDKFRSNLWRKYEAIIKKKKMLRNARVVAFQKLQTVEKLRRNLTKF